MLYPASASASAILPTPISITPLITSTVSVKQEIVYQDQPGVQTGEQALLFTSDPGPGQEQEAAETHSSQSRPNPQTQFGCQKCRRYSKSMKSLKAHYITEHYSKDLSHWVQGNKCLDCSQTFSSPNKLLVHLGFAHKKLEDLLARDGLVLDHPVSQNEVVGSRPVPPSSSKSKSGTQRSQRKSPSGKNISKSASVSTQPLALTQETRAESTAAAAENITLELEAEAGPSSGSVESRQSGALSLV